MESETHGAHAHASHGTGFRWLDISLALSAFLISLVSLFLGLHHGRTMDKLVASNSYPNLDAVDGNMYDMQDGRGLRPMYYVGLENTGIGPARIRTVELFFDDRAVPDFRTLLATCCTQEAPERLPKLAYFHPDDIRGSMLPAGRQRHLFTWPEAPDDPRWARFGPLRPRIWARACYCSVFDECFLLDSRKTEPGRVDACQVPQVPYLGH